ncbi:DUF58 domain-containing protein [Thermaerobacter composti]|uniref:DUF58 domain-containing protein n=1 Tax=Thermaerobacter composti TaxID=554949 RepID=A0ABZ0QPF7_9FIRM|nr:DUF58 domain-containing protein [Thermaerobacter composti]WPD19380.1 DUF58 domain-containing protein [Thermaerobacter composti]
MPPATPLRTIRPQNWGMPFWTLVALVFAVTTGGPVPWFLVKFLAALHLLAALWAWALARGLDVEVRVDRRRATVGEPVEVEVFVHNGSILPVPRLAVSLPGPVAGVLAPSGPGATDASAPGAADAGAAGATDAGAATGTARGTGWPPASRAGWTDPGGRTSTSAATDPRQRDGAREPAAAPAGMGPTAGPHGSAPRPMTGPGRTVAGAGGAAAPARSTTPTFAGGPGRGRPAPAAFATGVGPGRGAGAPVGTGFGPAPSAAPVKAAPVAASPVAAAPAAVPLEAGVGSGTGVASRPPAGAPVATGSGPGRPASTPVGRRPDPLQPAAAGRPSGPVLYRSLGPWGSLVWRQTLVVLRRGRYTLGPVTVELQEPLGIFRVRREAAAEAVLTVYPRVVPVDELAVLPRQPFGQQRVDTRAWQDPSSLADVRPFRPGDNPKHIHWKLSARLDELHVKEFELRATTDCFLFVDLGDPADGAVDADMPVAMALADGGEAGGFAAAAEPAAAEDGSAPEAAGAAATEVRRRAPGPTGTGHRRGPAPGTSSTGGTRGALAGPDAPAGGAAGAVDDGRPGEPGAAAVRDAPAGAMEAVPAVSLAPGEWVAGVTAGVAALALDRELTVAAAAPAHGSPRLPPGRGPQHFRRLLEWLVDLEGAAGMPLAEFLAAQRGWLTPRSAVLVVAHRLDRRLARVLVQLRGHGHAVGLWLVRATPDAADGTRAPFGVDGGADGAGAPWGRPPSGPEEPRERRSPSRSPSRSGIRRRGGGGRSEPGAPAADPPAPGRTASARTPGSRAAAPPRAPGSAEAVAAGVPAFGATVPAGATGPGDVGLGPRSGAPSAELPGLDETETLLRSLVRAGVAVHPVGVPPAVPVARGTALGPGGADALASRRGRWGP